MKYHIVFSSYFTRISFFSPNQSIFTIYSKCCFRRKREYANQDLEELLSGHNITTSLLMPKLTTGGASNVKLNADPEDPAPFPAYLPLETFDNTGIIFMVIIDD